VLLRLASVWMGVLSAALLGAASAAAQSHRAAGTEAFAAPDSKQLEQSVAAYERILSAPAGAVAQSVLDETRSRLATAHFLLHRYEESLHDLQPLASAGHGRLSAQAWIIQGLDELELNRLPEAIDSLKRATNANPKSATARLALGDALARSGRMEDASREYEKQTNLTPSVADAWYKLGMAHSQISVQMSRESVRPTEEDLIQQLNAEELLAKGDTLNAARSLFRLARQPSVRPDVQAELGTALLTLGYLKAAQDHFSQELATNSESPLAEIGLLQTAALGGDWAQVENRFEQMSWSHPQELSRLLEMPPVGMVLQAAANGQLTPTESFSLSPVGALWKNWLSDTNVVARISNRDEQEVRCVAMKDLSPGVWLTDTCYAKLLSQWQRRADLSFNASVKRTEAEFRLGRYDAALRSARRLRTVDPQSGWAVYWLSRSHDAIAEQSFLKVGALNPDSARVHQMLAEHYLKLSDYPRAEGEFQSALRLSPDSPDLHLGLGMVLSRCNQWTQAEKELKATLESVPKSAFAHYQLGHVYVQQGQWQPAIEQFREVPDDSTVALSARLDLAKAESEVGRSSEAIKDLLSVAALDQDGELYFRLAALYRSTGDQARAREALATFKQRRMASLETDNQELGALEKEQEITSAQRP
jgi:tetratricopeptide (TPR) repeat protein